MNKRQLRRQWNKFWYFIWEDDSILSWIVNIALAFILIKFIVYPGLSLVFGTSHPVVAVVSESMHHDENFDEWWDSSRDWYEKHGITKEMFADYTMSNGFNKGDIIILRGAPSPAVGEIIVFQTRKPEPIIHRVVMKWEENGQTIYQTKGDNYQTNPAPIKSPLIDETRIVQEQIIGKAVLRIPFLGYIKIAFVELIEYVRGVVRG